MGRSSRQQPGRQIEGSKAVLDGAREFQLEFPKSLASQADEGDVVFLCNPGDLPINKDLLELALADGQGEGYPLICQDHHRHHAGNPVGVFFDGEAVASAADDQVGGSFLRVFFLLGVSQQPEGPEFLIGNVDLVERLSGPSRLDGFGAIGYEDFILAVELASRGHSC